MTNVPQPSEHPKWEAFKSNFTQSNYITDFWNWFMTLMSKAAEMVLFGTVLYSGYQLLSGVPHVPPTIDAAVFVIQQGALDIGGMGLLKLAKRANLAKDSFPVRLGVALVVLMILNVALASIKHTLPMIPDGVFVGIETLLLIARAVVAVLFGHAIHALREEYGESTITVKEAQELQQAIDGLALEFAHGQENFHRRLSSELSHMRDHFHLQLSSELSPLHESLQHVQATLADVSPLKAQLQHLESSTGEEFRRLKATLVKLQQGHAGEREGRAERPVLRALPPIQQEKAVTPQATVMGKFDARTFVFACLRENPDLKLSQIEQRARAAGQELSQPTASRYRKQFFASRESSPMKTESSDESSSMKAESFRESSTRESAFTDENKVVGE